MPVRNSGTKKRFISDVELEAEYGIARKTLQKWRLFGKGPRFCKFEGAVRYEVSDIEAWVETSRRGTVQATA
ncbi:MAG: helix-turn-helix transcriptional regulator [Bryobacteraceae bacterium]